ncbi:MAG: CAP domain-containing protein [Proteobacteria bacterium]|nr:CAP domain-containing protein [Pseudomonadota bacterium]
MLAMIAAGCAPAARAAAIDAVNRGRAQACGPAFAALTETRELDAVARAVAAGRTLHQALGMLPVRPQYAAEISLAGSLDERSLATTLARRPCGDLGRHELREAGIARSGGVLYVVAVAPLPVPAAADARRVAREVLDRVNAARSAGRRCGSVHYPAAPPLALSEALSRIAAGHSAAMGARDDLEHEDPDGSTPADRVRRGGYAARLVGENIASGAPTAAEVVQGWLASPGHCANIMDRRFSEMGIAFRVAPRSRGAIYWTQLLAAPRV